MVGTSSREATGVGIIFFRDGVTEQSTPRGGGQSQEPKPQQADGPRPALQQAPSTHARRPDRTGQDRTGHGAGKEQGKARRAGKTEAATKGVSQREEVRWTPTTKRLNEPQHPQLPRTTTAPTSQHAPPTTPQPGNHPPTTAPKPHPTPPRPTGTATGQEAGCPGGRRPQASSAPQRGTPGSTDSRLLTGQGPKARQSKARERWQEGRRKAGRGEAGQQGETEDERTRTEPNRHRRPTQPTQQQQQASLDRSRHRPRGRQQHHEVAAARGACTNDEAKARCGPLREGISG